MGLAINMVYAQDIVHPETRVILAHKGTLAKAIGLEALVALGIDEITLTPIMDNGFKPETVEQCEVWQFRVYV